MYWFTFFPFFCCRIYECGYFALHSLWIVSLTGIPTVFWRRRTHARLCLTCVYCALCCVGETCLVGFGLCSTALLALANFANSKQLPVWTPVVKNGSMQVHRLEHGPRTSVFHIPCMLLLHVFFSINVTFSFFRLGLPALNVRRWARSPYFPVKPASVHICVLVASLLASSTGSWQNFTKRSVAASVWIFCTFCLKSCIRAESKNYFAFGCSLVAFVTVGVETHFSFPSFLEI